MITHRVEPHDLALQVYRALGDDRRLDMLRRERGQPQLLKLVNPIASAARTTAEHLFEHRRCRQIHRELPLSLDMGSPRTQCFDSGIDSQFVEDVLLRW